MLLQIFLGFRPRWRCRLTHCASSHNQKKDDNNLRTKNNKNWQKIELHGSLTTKEIKKKHSSRLVGAAERGSRGREDLWQGSGWRTQWGSGLWNRAGSAAPHSHIDKSGGTVGERKRPRNPGLQHREIKPQTSDWKHPWGLRQPQEKLPASHESSLERPTGPESMHKPTHSGISTRGALFDCG